MFVELHILQNFAPSCLNRDETNSPKDCQFGGYPRGRVSSQCWKKSIRDYFVSARMFDPELLGIRTRWLVDKIADPMIQAGKDADKAMLVAETAIKGWGLGLKEKGRTEYLQFLTPGEINALASVCLANWDALCRAAEGPADPPAEDAPKTKKQRKKEAKEAVPTECASAFKEILANGGKAVDVALFGRMLANQAGAGRDAACQVAHAISVNQVSTEFDFFTAVDDLSGEEPGTAMMGTVEFNSPCFYRYSNIDLEQLTKNLHNDKDLAQKALIGFLLASVAAIPTGKQSSMAAQNPPSLVFAVVREKGLWSLTNAFAQPVRPGNNGGLLQTATNALENYWQKLAAAYGEGDIRRKAVLAVDCEIESLKKDKVNNLAELVKAVQDAIQERGTSK